MKPFQSILPATMLIMKLLLVLVFASLSFPAQAALKIQAWTLANGARVLFVESRAIPILDVSVEFDAGSRRDPPGKTGTASVTNAMLARGIQESAGPPAEPAMTEAQISNAFADIAAQRGGNAGNDRAGMTLRTLSSPQQRDKAVAVLGRILAQPSFPQSLLERDKARIIAAIKEELTQPETIANRAFWPLLYGRHPYGSIPTPESVAAVTRDDLVAFHRKHYVADRAVISMIGSITRDEADQIARRLTERLPRGEPLEALPAVPATDRQEKRIAHPASQSHILIGAPALERGDPDYFPLTVGNYILGGGGFVSRLMHEVREKRGLAYSVHSYFLPLAQQGPFEVSMQTSKSQTSEALQVVRDTMSGFIRTGPTADELQAAKDNLIGGFALRLDNNLKILENIAVIGFYRLPLDYLDTWTQKIARVTAADVQAAFRRKVGPERLATVVVGAE
ncbi:M16 family metallopeptidase [Noviherbaspirillum sp.]|uniref:M16 family metallopeptidase n=1 Tax=Noviherbaspirillum sp. TaxID=1926288 RepID=UPI0039C9453A